MRRPLIFTTIYLLSGCTTIPVPVKLHTPVQTKSIEALQVQYTYLYLPENSREAKYFRNAYSSANATEKPAIRNRIIYELLTAIDDNYFVFESNLRETAGMKDTVVDWLSLTLTGAASISTGGAPRILAAIDTGLKGANASVDKNMLGAMVPTLLINRMRADRSDIEKKLYTSMKLTDSEYPLEAALRDIVNYWAQGSVTAAMSSLAAATAKQADTAAGAATDARTVQTSASAATAAAEAASAAAIAATTAARAASTAATLAATAPAIASSAAAAATRPEK